MKLKIKFVLFKNGEKCFASSDHHQVLHFVIPFNWEKGLGVDLLVQARLEFSNQQRFKIFLIPNGWTIVMTFQSNWLIASCKT